MTAYYNEIDPYAAQWLRNLIEAGHIAPGEVDTRSIVDVRPDELAGFEQCHFFAGLGGWSGAIRLAGVADTVPLWTGSCPCQPFSLAGKQKGFADERHLWPIWRELIRERRPAKVFGEQVASATEWLGLVRSDLEAMGYAVGAMPIQAASAGADHLRDRYWFVAHHDGGRQCGSEVREEQPGRTEIVGNGEAGAMEHDTSERRGERRPEHEVRERSGPTSTGTSGVSVADAHNARSQGRRILPERAGERTSGPDGMANTDQFLHRRERQHDSLEWVIGADGKARRVKSGVRLLAHGVPARVAKLRALGNAIDLRPAAAFIGAAMTEDEYTTFAGQGDPS